MHSTAAAADFCAGGGRGHQISTVATGLRYDGVDLLMLLLLVLVMLVLVMLVVLLVNVMNLGIVCSKSSRFKRSAAALLLIATDAK